MFCAGRGPGHWGGSAVCVSQSVIFVVHTQRIFVVCMDCNQVIFIYIVCRNQYDLQIVLFVTSCNSTRLSFSRACNLSCSCVIAKVHFMQDAIF